MTYNKSVLLENLGQMSIELNDKQLNDLDIFSSMLIEKNKVMNLTAITDPDGIAIKHFADSLSAFCATAIPDNSKIIDVGTGAGFPGLPMLICNNTLKLTLLDSTSKRLAFIDEVLSALHLNADTLHARAEEVGKDADYRENFDFVVSRAVAPLNILCEYCIPLIRVGGRMIAMKGSQLHDEIPSANKAIAVLGGKIINEVDFSLSNGDPRSILVIEKIKNTPKKFPRPSAQIAKKTL